SNIATVTALDWPAAPSGLTTTVVSNTEIDLTWTDNATDASSYTVDRTTDGTTWTSVATLGSDATSYNDTGLSDGTLYGYRVRAINDTGGSGYEVNAAATLPTAPTNLQAVVVSGTEMDLSWDAAPYASGYTISMEVEGSTTWQVIGTVPAGQTTYAATGLSPGGVYYAFTVAPTNSTAASAVAYLDPGTQNTAPVIENMSAGADPVTTTSTVLSALVTDDQLAGGPLPALSFHWELFSHPAAGGGWFTDDGLATTTFNFYAAGTFYFQLTVTDGDGNSTVSSLFPVTVQQTLTGINVTPHDTAILEGGNQQFLATAVDQFGNNMQFQPDFTWSVSGPGTISSNGWYFAPSSGAATTFTVSASSGGNNGTANVAIKDNQFRFVGTDNGVYVQATDVHEVKDFSTSGVLQGTLPFNGPFPPGLTFRGAASIYLADGSYLDASALTLVRRDAAGNIIQTYIDSPADAWTGMVLDPNGTSFWACDESCYVFEFDIDTGAQQQKFWASGDLGGLGAQPSLLELTVRDAQYVSNKVTAIDSAIQNLYVPEDETTDGAKIKLTPVYDPFTSAFADEVHVKVERVTTDQNGQMVDDLTVANGLWSQYEGDPIISLLLTNEASDFQVTTWLDDDPNDKLEVDVHVEKPWTDIGTWTAGTAALVQANADNASLAKLAYDITGNTADVVLLSDDVEKVTKGMYVDVTPLLKILDARTRSAIVTAAQNPPEKNFTAGFGAGPNPPGFALSEIGAEGINTLFSGADLQADLPEYNCEGMMQITLARGLIQGAALSDAEFDELLSSFNA
ncbi:MAG TPA: fibronectin type III domain-containing protein, partial [Pirellulales bacterium]|nr:fibronectin type III domain-containing protein [Pirellulales bacterium]